jgi:hypothetical protein
LTDHDPLVKDLSLSIHVGTGKKVDDVLLAALRDLLQGALRQLTWEELVQPDMLSEVTSCLKCLLQVSTMSGEINSITWAKSLLHQAIAAGLERGKLDSMPAQTVLKALMVPVVLAKLEALQRAKPEKFDVQKVSAAEVVLNYSDWISTHLDCLINAADGASTRNEPTQRPVFAECFFGFLDGELAPLEGVTCLPHSKHHFPKLLLQYFELCAFESIGPRSRTVSGTVTARDPAINGVLLIHRISLYCNLLAQGLQVGAINTRQGWLCALSFGRLIIESVRGGGLRCNNNATQDCACCFPLRVVIEIINRLLHDLDRKWLGTTDVHLDVGKMRSMQVEAASMCCASSLLMRTNYAAMVPDAFRAHLELDAAIDIRDVSSVIKYVQTRAALNRHRCESPNLAAEFSDAAHMLELSGSPLEASDVLTLALLCSGDWWCKARDPPTLLALSATCGRLPSGMASLAFVVQLLYRQVACLAEVFLGPFSAGIVASALASARRWWGLAEAIYEELMPTETDKGLLCSVDACRVRASAMLPQSLQPETDVSFAPLTISEPDSSTGALTKADMLQAHADWAFQWQHHSMSKNQDLECGADTSLRSGLSALALISQQTQGVKVHEASSAQHLDRSAAEKAQWARACDRWTLSRCILLHLRVLLQLGLGYERIGFPNLADYYFHTGLQVLSKKSCWAARWRLKFLCARARLALNGWPCMSLPPFHAHFSGEVAGQDHTCNSVNDPWAELKQFWRDCFHDETTLVLTHDFAAEGGLPIMCASFVLVDGVHKGAKATGEANFDSQLDIGSSLGHFSQWLRFSDERHDWKLHVSRLAGMISEVRGPLHASLCGELLNVADVCAQRCFPLLQVDAPDCVNFSEPHIVAPDLQDMACRIVGSLERCHLLVRSTLNKEWQSAVKRSLLDLRSLEVPSTLLSASQKLLSATYNFDAALTLNIAAMELALRIGEDAAVRYAANQVVSLSFDAASCVAHMLAQGDSSHQLLAQKLETQPASKRRRTQKRLDAYELALRICGAAVPLCSGTSVFFLHRLRAMQREDHVAQWSGHAANDVEKYVDCSWMAELPADVAVAWLQFDRIGQTLRISRRVDGPHRNEVDTPLVLWCIRLENHIFEQLEMEFQRLQREHHTAVHSFVQKEDCNDASQRKIFWSDRERFDKQLGRIACSIQGELLREWRFLLTPWPRSAEARSSIAENFKTWSSSEPLVNTWASSSESRSRSCLWILMLLYWSADQMQHSEIALVLASVMRTSGVSTSGVSHAATSLVNHSMSSLFKWRQLVTHLPLLLFVDSAVAQFPLEACPCLSALEVVRGVAPNITLMAFEKNGKSSSLSTSSSSSTSLIRSDKEDIDQCALNIGVQGAADELVLQQQRRPQSGFYVLDPTNQVVSCTQSPLVSLLQKWSATRDYGNWTGYVGQGSTLGNEVMVKLGSQDVFVYMGHGQAAKKIMHPDALQRGAPVLNVGEQQGTVSKRRGPLHSIIMLMGCSTAKISKLPREIADCERATPLTVKRNGWCKMRHFAESEFEAFAMPLNVLIGGGPAMIGALWDVLEGDLQQLSVALLQGWMASSQTQKSAGDHATPLGLSAALKRSRVACKLRFLTGAAVVCYGIPM